MDLWTNINATFFPLLSSCCLRSLLYGRSKIPLGLAARSAGEVLYLCKPLHMSRGSTWSMTVHTHAVRCKIWAVHSNPCGARTLSLWKPVSYSNICRIRALQVQGRLGSGSVWYRLEACAQIQSHLPLGAMHSPKGNACLGMSSCCCAAVLHVSAVLWTLVFEDVWIIPWQMVGFTLLYARMCLRWM